MLRSLRLLCPGRPQRAFSALTGNSYPPSIASKLSALGFQSDLWLTEKQMSAIGVEVAPEHKNKGYAMQSGSGITFSLYNASQTTDLGRVEKMKGRLAVFNALTRERIRGNAETCLQEHHGKFTSNEWLSDRDIDMLCMKLKPDAKPISVTYEFDDTVIGADGTTTTETRKVTRGYYNIDQVEDAEILVRSRKVMPISASTGRRYHGTAMHVLLRRSIESGYDSPFWITMQGAQALGLLIKNPSAGVEINAGENRIVTLYNACETTDPQKVSSAAYNAKFSARSAVSGAVYPPESQAHLKAASTKNGYRSVYWLSKKQASILGVSIRDGEHPTSITTDTGVVELYNADQTNDKSIVESRFGARS